MRKVRWANRQEADKLRHQILAAAKGGDAAGIRMLVPQADISDEGWLYFWVEPLLVACKAGHTEVVQVRPAAYYVRSRRTYLYGWIFWPTTMTQRLFF